MGLQLNTCRWGSPHACHTRPRPQSCTATASAVHGHDLSRARPRPQSYTALASVVHDHGLSRTRPLFCSCTTARSFTTLNFIDLTVPTSDHHRPITVRLLSCPPMGATVTWSGHRPVPLAMSTAQRPPRSKLAAAPAGVLKNSPTLPTARP